MANASARKPPATRLSSCTTSLARFSSTLSLSKTTRSLNRPWTSHACSGKHPAKPLSSNPSPRPKRKHPPQRLRQPPTPPSNPSNLAFPQMKWLPDMPKRCGRHASPPSGTGTSGKTQSSTFRHRSAKQAGPLPRATIRHTPRPQPST